MCSVLLSGCFLKLEFELWLLVSLLLPEILLLSSPLLLSLSSSVPRVFLIHAVVDPLSSEISLGICRRDGLMYVPSSGGETRDVGEGE